MANQLPFKPVPVDPRTEHGRRLAEAPAKHAEALLVAWDILQSAHDQGLLDAAHGLIQAKNTVAGKIAEYAKLPESEAGIRNLLAVARIISTIDPETLDHLSNATAIAAREHQQEESPPSLWQLFKRANSEDGRRGLSFLTLLLTHVGRSLKG